MPLDISVTAVHPRGRGKHDEREYIPAITPGSSPRARETFLLRVIALAGNRFIPAGAGNIESLSVPVWRVPVHPRGRGKHISRIKARVEDTGSSPRARETLMLSMRYRHYCRFIPAGAGNMCQSEVLCCRFSVHPRGRGKHPYCLTEKIHRVGSSPRARETLITHWHSALAVPVHPRGRGKHDCRYSNHDLLYGSSPRARETYPANSVVFQANRFIPAGAGNMGISKKLPFTVSVHPRGRGKHEHHSGLFAPVIGSSPRARET